MQARDDKLSSLVRREQAERRVSSVSAAGVLSVAPVDVPWADASVFVPVGSDSFRAVSGRQRGELLPVVRDGEERVVKLYLATYPFTRTPQTYGPD